MSGRKSRKPEEPIKQLQINAEEVEALRARIEERKIEEGDWDRLRGYLDLLVKLVRVLEYGRVRMRKLTRLLFGKPTEKDNPKKPPSDSPPPAAGGKTAASGESGAGTPPEHPTDGEESRRKGHGRNPASAYKNAKVKVCPVCGQKAGDPCPCAAREACGRWRRKSSFGSK